MLPPYGLVTPRLIAALIVLLGNGSNHSYALYGTFVVLSFLHLPKIYYLCKSPFASRLLRWLAVFDRWSWRGFLFYVSHAQRDVYPCAFVVLVLGTDVLLRFGGLVTLLDDLHALDETLVARFQIGRASCRERVWR